MHVYELYNGITGWRRNYMFKDFSFVKTMILHFFKCCHRMEMEIPEWDSFSKYFASPCVYICSFISNLYAVNHVVIYNTGSCLKFKCCFKRALLLMLAKPHIIV